MLWDNKKELIRSLNQPGLLTKCLQNQTYGNLHKKQKAMLVLAMQG